MLHTETRLTPLTKLLNAFTVQELKNELTLMFQSAMYSNDEFDRGKMAYTYSEMMRFVDGYESLEFGEN
jgi:hypothetical protein